MPLTQAQRQAEKRRRFKEQGLLKTELHILEHNKTLLLSLHSDMRSKRVARIIFKEDSQ